MLENELFEQAPVHKAYFKFALPVVFSMVVSLVYNMVDTYFIAQTGNNKSGSRCFSGSTDFYFDDRSR